MLEILLTGINWNMLGKMWSSLDWNLLELLWAGALGGFALALGRMLVTFASINSPEPRIKQFLMAQWLSLTALPILGVILTWVTQGIAGAFFTGLGALGFILLLTGPHHQAHTKHDEAPNA
ncbi:hypothetical protein [Arthrobacter sp. HY1533]|uniref:hypothetical protein n=1 Tax=Arthrobacter sp. HY1533 TaxID=2970919 RepID=UPI0022B9F708|nr:hypothetical protein [Arthrobacter sp. HY1533]